MFFRKKKMVDVRELQRRGIVRIPRNETEVITDKEGFVDLNSPSNKTISTPKPKSSGLFSFMNPSSDSSSSYSDPPTQSEFSTETNGYNKREVDVKIESLDNKIYKLEQRIELLERKAGVGASSTPSIGW